MSHDAWLARQSEKTLARLLPRLEETLKKIPDAAVFHQRLHTHFPRAFRLLHALYGDQYDFFYYLEQILQTIATAFKTRSDALKALDAQREADPTWYLSHNMMGAVCYVDLFAGTLDGVRDKLPYLKELGITYLHLMPLFKSPATNNDGGYAVSDYRQTDPKLGTMADLANLATTLRNEGISLVLDFVFNHTSNEHPWAKQALSGDENFQEYYYMYPDRTLPDQYERTLREIFPEQAPGSFTFVPELQKWVWTSFYNFQWDLNYSNPAVFNAMLGEMLFLANQGVEILRLDAVAFIWKQMGTACESLPQAHWIIQAFNALVKIAAPALLFKSEAIVHPDDVASYISVEESPISYNPTLMALLWESLATRKVTLLQHSMSRRYSLPEKCTWVNYVRVHDDIGWTFADEDAAEVMINGYDHRLFLNYFYTGQFGGSFAKGLPFNYNPRTGDMRISGTAASLAGLEQALELNDPIFIENAINRLMLIHSIILSTGGIPLLYLGDELATLNDYSYKQDPEKKDDSRWVHRPKFDAARAAQRRDITTLPGQMFQGLQRLIHIRKQHPVFAGDYTLFFDTQNPHVLGYLRNQRLLILANFSEAPQTIKLNVLRAFVPLENPANELISGTKMTIMTDVVLSAYDFRWWVFNDTAQNT